jgi:hypothetical protein
MSRGKKRITEDPVKRTKRDRRQSLFISEKKGNGEFPDLFSLPSDKGSKRVKPLG